MKKGKIEKRRRKVRKDKGKTEAKRAQYMHRNKKTCKKGA
jgi:hypothetical protein